MNILVTGANGYMGQGIVKELLDSGHEVIALDINTDNIDDRAEKIKTDLFRMKDPSIFGQSDVLLHLAWRDGFRHNSIRHMADLNAHYKFIADAVGGGGIAHICVLGSMHEIGWHEGSVDEYTPTNPQNLYGISKNALRQAVLSLCRDASVVFQWIRGFYIVGNVAKGSSVFSKIYEAEKAGKEIFPFTMGTNQYDFIDYDLFCKQVAAVVGQESINGIINCCSGFPQKLSERVEKFINENDYKIRLQYGAFPDRPYDSKAIWGNDNKIRKILKLKEDRYRLS